MHIVDAISLTANPVVVFLKVCIGSQPHEFICARKPSHQPAPGSNRIPVADPAGTWRACSTSSRLEHEDEIDSLLARSEDGVDSRRIGAFDMNECCEVRPMRRDRLPPDFAPGSPV